MVCFTVGHGLLCFGEWSDVLLGMVWFHVRAVRLAVGSDLFYVWLRFALLLGGGLRCCVAWVAILRELIWCTFRSGRSALSLGGVCFRFGSGLVYV